MAGERRGAGLMEDLEVGPVIEDAAAGTSEDAPVRAWRRSRTSSAPGMKVPLGSRGSLIVRAG